MRRIPLASKRRLLRHRSLSRKLAAWALALLGLMAGACGSTAPAPDPREGQALYLSRGCAACHGLEGRGDGPAAAGFAQHPRDLRRADSYRGALTIDEISRVIADGMGGTMPAQPFLPPEEREAIAAFVLELAHRDAPAPLPADPDTARTSARNPNPSHQP